MQAKNGACLLNWMKLLVNSSCSAIICLSYRQISKCYITEVDHDESNKQNYKQRTISSRNVGTLIGAVASDFLPEILTASLGISLYAMFIGLLIPNLTNNYKLGGLVVLTALCNTLLSQVIDSSWALIISTLLCAFIGVFFVDLDEWSVCWQPSPPIFFYTYLFNRNHT